ncbi:MAG: radical SAM protein [Sulfolobales archaeon]
MSGAKSVVFATGLCSVGCYYCPISPQRKSRDVVYVNDVAVESLRDLVEEVAASMSEGVGITGGEPLLVLDRVLEVIKVLKDVFGSRFHVHLYTSGVGLTEEIMGRLVSAGLDELRVHVVSDRSLEAVELALNYPVDVVVENPAIPSDSERLKNLVSTLSSLGVKYVNLNELEVSELNFDLLSLKGFRVSSSGRSVEGSREVALEVLKWVEEAGLGLSVHYCPALYKDAYQYPRRLLRRALATRRVFEELGYGLVKWVEVECYEELEKLVPVGLVFKFGSTCFTHPRVGASLELGRVVEALPLTPRKALNEY